MEIDIIDEIEKHLATYRCNPNTLKLKFTEDVTDENKCKTGGFNKSWCKLGLPEKINRLMKYLTILQTKMNLDAKQSETLRKFFYENVNMALASDDYVNYDPVEGEIVTILGLKYESDNFYIQTQAVKPEGLRVKKPMFRNLLQMNEPAIDEQPSSVNKKAPELTELPVTEKKKVLVIKKK
jgi:hypothetical protein